jgi:LDH2 family malate/lactate/ureidoglycolate dehydrogenase
VRDLPSIANIDGDRGLGIVHGERAMNLAVEKAKSTGVGVVLLHNSGHLGAVGYYAMHAAQQDMVGVCMTAAGMLVLPTFGAEPRLGTNPISVAAPAKNEPFLLYDAATSAIAGNKIELARRVDALLEPRWIAGIDGAPYLEPVAAPPRGEFHQLPLGGTREQGSHKGYGLALMVEVLGSVLAGMPPSMLIGRQGLRANHYFAAYNIAAFGDVEQFKETMDQMLRHLQNTPPAPGEERVIYPGIPEYEAELERREDGIPLHREVIEWFDATTERLGVEKLQTKSR